MRIIVEEAVTGKILSRDLKVLEPKVVTNLSGPAMIEFKVPYMEPSADGINFKAFGQWIHIEEDVYISEWNKMPLIIASGLLDPTTVDKDSGALVVRATGFSAYAKGIPWLDDYNPVTVDVFHVVHRIWNHIQSKPQGNLGVQVVPADSGAFLLPGFGWDGTNFNIEFFAMFVRASDMRDCGDEVDKLARDIPFDYAEVSFWNPTRTAITKQLQLSYPKRGSRRTSLSFQFGVNVIDGEPASETDIEWASDVIVRGWWPGRVYSSQLSNADPTRYRRVVKEEDAKINSRERAAVWAKRKLARRQVPKYWKTITIDGNHIDALYGSFGLGDEILVRGHMPWVGKVEEWHRIVSMSVDNLTGQIELGLKHEGAFNYDPIDFPPLTS